MLCESEFPKRRLGKKRSALIRNPSKTKNIRTLCHGRTLCRLVINKRSLRLRSEATAADVATRQGVVRSLRLKWGGLSLTSLSFTVTVVVPVSPPRCPPMSLAWRTTRYSSCVSLSMSGTAVRRMPGGEGSGEHNKKKKEKRRRITTAPDFTVTRHLLALASKRVIHFKTRRFPNMRLRATALSPKLTQREKSSFLPNIWWERIKRNHIKRINYVKCSHQLENPSLKRC